MTTARNRLPFIENERILLGRHVAASFAGRPARAEAKAVAPDEVPDSLLPAFLILLLTLAMVTALVIPY